MRQCFLPMCVTLLLIELENIQESVFNVTHGVRHQFLKMPQYLRSLGYNAFGWHCIEPTVSLSPSCCGLSVFVRPKLTLYLYLICSPIICSVLFQSCNANSAALQNSIFYLCLPLLSVDKQLHCLFLWYLFSWHATSAGQSYLGLDKSQLQIVIRNGIALIKFR